VRDLREHGVEVRPVDVNHSDWDATLEPGERAAARLDPLHHDMAGNIRSTHALRLGLRKIKGLSQEHGRMIVQNRAAGYACVRDLWLRTGLPTHVIARLADADAFGSLELTRRQALWAAKALGRVGAVQDDLPLFRTSVPAAPAEISIPREPAVRLPAMPLGEQVVNDYRFLELSLRAHPASFLRADLTRHGIIRNEELRALPRGACVRVSGLITVRQQPGAANGVIFMTIEDETAIANIIVWPKTFGRFRPVIMGARYVAVSGELQQESGVIHVVAARLDDLTSLLARLTEDAPPIESLARADAVKRPHDEDVDSRARGRRNPPRIAAPSTPPDLLASDLDVPARGSAHAPARRGGAKIGRP